MSDLTILTITDYPFYAPEFLDDLERLADDLDAEFVEWDGTGAVAIEHGVWDEAVAACPDGWILRLDHDEKASPELVDWLARREYRAYDNWQFPRLNYWPDRDSVVCYPDFQTRLSVKAKSGGRTRMHQGSPFGPGAKANVHIEHWKLLLVSVDERRAQVEEREAMQPGAGYQFRPFLVPEDVPGIEVIRLPVEAAITER